jgi:hypothetical protein
MTSLFQRRKELSDREKYPYIEMRIRGRKHKLQIT